MEIVNVLCLSGLDRIVHTTFAKAITGNGSSYRQIARTTNRGRETVHFNEVKFATFSVVVDSLALSLCKPILTSTIIVRLIWRRNNAINDLR